MPSAGDEGNQDLVAALLGLAFATSVWPWVFRARRPNFWIRMPLVSGALGLHALQRRPEMLAERPAWKDVAAGVGSAAGLYAIFQIGDRLARRIMPAGGQDIEETYALRTLAPRPAIAALLIGVIAPSEELFWRGLLQRALIGRFGRVKGTALAAAAYGGVHLGSGNLTLTGAATVAGAYWGSEYSLDGRMIPLLLSHILWDVWIFLLQPTPGGKRSR